MAYLMDSEAIPTREGYIKNSTLILLAFASAFFPRVLSSLGFPSVVNFLHFAIVPLVSGYVLMTSRRQTRQQVETVRAIILGLGILLGVMLTSALLNNAGVINVFLSFMLLAEPFMLLLAIASVPMPPSSYDRIRKWFIYFCLFHIFLAYIQYYVLRLHLTRALAGADLIQGVFYLSGAGHVVGSAVAMIFSLYFFFTAKDKPLWIRGAVIPLALWQLLLSDAKQVLLSLLLDWVLLLITKFKNIGQLVKYTIAAVLISYGLFWCINNVEAFAAFNTWSRPELYGPDGEATMLKSASIQVISSYHTSPLNWLFGLGPGHTVGRLGGWMLREYASLLNPLGATIHPASNAVWTIVGNSWLGNQTSMFSPFFGWAGIWGDFGFLGLAAYLYLGYTAWCKLARDDFSKFLLLDVLVVGLILSQMEEPGYMLTVAMLVGLKWQERQSQQRSTLPPPLPLYLQGQIFQRQPSQNR